MRQVDNEINKKTDRGKRLSNLISESNMAFSLEKARFAVRNQNLYPNNTINCISKIIKKYTKSASN